MTEPGASGRRPIVIDPNADILGLTDLQPTFMPGGELPVPEGDRVVPAINRLLAVFDHAFATQDWHPPGHISFASAHPGKAPADLVETSYGRQILWPDHALQNSRSAALHPDLDQSKVEVVIRKGFRPWMDSYSTFFENDGQTATGLDGYLKSRGFRRIFLTGLALDFCVAYSAKDAVRLGYEVVVVIDACRGVGLPLSPGVTTIEQTEKELLAEGVTLLSCAEILAAGRTKIAP
jgi:nicotinamidase/pyrazinamidase